jgi:hypothetical protein
MSRYLVSLTGNVTAFEPNPFGTVSEAKEAIQDKTGIPPEQLRLYLCPDSVKEAANKLVAGEAVTEEFKDKFGKDAHEACKASVELSNEEPLPSEGIFISVLMLRGPRPESNNDSDKKKKCVIC